MMSVVQQPLNEENSHIKLSGGRRRAVLGEYSRPGRG